jgi:hypothetical protein
MSFTAHSVRNSMPSNELTFRLTDDALETEETGKITKTPYGEIEQLNLISYSTSVGKSSNLEESGHIHGQLSIKSKTGKPIKVRSHHFKSIGSYEDRSASYAPFVRELCQRVASANPAAGFFSGSVGLRYMWLGLLIFLVLVGAMLGLVLIAGNWKMDVIVGCIIAAFGASVAWRNFQSNQRQTFDAANPPAEYLDL